MRAKLLLWTLLLFLVPAAFATQFGQVGSSTALYFTPAQAAIGANVSIYAPNGSVVVNNATMTQIGGVWQYSFTPTVAGNFLLLPYFANSSGSVTSSSDVLSVSSSSTSTNVWTPLIVGILTILIGFLALYFISQLDETHYLLKVIVLLFVAVLFLIAGKAALDAAEPCYIINGQLQCFQDPHSTALNLYTTIILLGRLFVVYVFAYFFWLVFFKKNKELMESAWRRIFGRG